MERHLYKMKKDIPYQVFGFGPLIYKVKFSNKEKTDLKNLCKKDKKKDHRSRLAGNIRNEYSIDHIKYEKIINNYLEVFEKDAYPFFYKRKALSKLQSEGAERTSAVLTVLTGAMNAQLNFYFNEVWPLNLSSIEFNSTSTEVDYVTANVSFRYDNYRVENLLNNESSFEGTRQQN